MHSRLRLAAFPLLALASSLTAPGTARAEEPLFTEGRRGQPARTIPEFTRLARTLGPAVVNIVAMPSAEPPAAGAEGGSSRPRQKGQGTGFIIHKSGYILTNTHVVESSDDIRVRLADDRELTAKLIGKDERTDIALLKIEAPGPLEVAPLGNSDEVAIGEWVIAIGNPFGLDHTVTAGIVSAKGRRDVRPGGSRTGFYDFIQTDASINPGNSGGPLINARGEVIGINTAMNAQAQGIGFAIPINMVKVIAPLLRTHGRAPRSWFGIHPQSITAQLKKAFNLVDMKGALISEVVPESPAGRAGLVAGDVITDFAGHSIRRADDLMWLIATTPAAKRIDVRALRAGKVMKLTTSLELSPDDAPPAPKPPAPPPKKSPLGMTVSEISASIAKELNQPNLRGVVVMSVESESPAIEAGVERGDLIVRIGDATVSTLDDYAKAVRALGHGDMIKMLVKRDAHNVWVAFAKR